MCSDPQVREAVLTNLDMMGGAAWGHSYGALARQLLPRGATVGATKAAVNSLAYSANRSPRLRITKSDGALKVEIIRL